MFEFLRNLINRPGFQNPAEESLQRAHAQLERRVAERTAELSAANRELQREIAERERAQQALNDVNEELRLKNREMEQFVYLVSHDLKSPLVTMMGFVGLLRDDLAAGRINDVLDSADRIAGASQRMSRLIDGLLELSRVGRIVHEPEEVDSTQLVREIATELQGRLAEKGARLEIDKRMPHVLVDRIRLNQVFENLLTNAIKYGCTGPQPTIRVGSLETPEEIRFYVRDNGPGIARKDQERVFGLFQRLDTGEDGTGIGLSIAARVMEVHGGRAWVESEVGSGACFWIAFPRTRPAPRAGQEQGCIV